MRFPFWIYVICSIALILAVGHAQEPPPAGLPDKQIRNLIDKLPAISQGDVGYMPTRSGGAFLPLGKSDTGTMLLFKEGPAPSETMRQLVAQGAASIPHLIAHLDDKRETKIKLKHDSFFGGMLFSDEYDYNRRTAKGAPVDVNRDIFAGNEKHPNEHTVTVGDLCFVALGQIVNRQFSAVRYQPTAITMVNSPTYSERLRNVVRAEWGTLTPGQHKASLIRDFEQPDHEGRRTGAVVRLGYFYPEALEPLVLKQLAEPIIDVAKVHQLVHGSLYSAKNAEERKAFLDSFIAKTGEHSRAEVLDQLFDDLDLPDFSGPKARECLVELFGYLKEVHVKDRPVVVLNTETSQARLIDAIARFHSPKIDSAVRKVLHATDDEYLARACVRYLVGRGADQDIREYVEKRDAIADAERQRGLRQILDQLGWTELHVAASEYENEWLEHLIAKGGDVNAAATNGKTPLHVAAEHGSYGGLEILIKHKADLNRKDKDSKTPVQLAMGYDAAVEMLLDAGAEVPDILVAAFAGRDELVKRFLESDRALSAIRSEHGDTPLHFAAQNGYLKTAELLIAADADVNARDNEHNKLTPLHLAAIYGHGKIIALLLANKGDRTARDWDGKTPLDHAREKRHEGVVRMLETP